MLKQTKINKEREVSYDVGVEDVNSSDTNGKWLFNLHSFFKISELLNCTSSKIKLKWNFTISQPFYIFIHK